MVNASPEESSLDRYSAKDLREQLGPSHSLTAPDASAWITMAFRAAARRSLIQPALMFALLMLVIEAVAIGVRSRRVA